MCPDVGTNMPTMPPLGQSGHLSRAPAEAARLYPCYTCLQASNPQRGGKAMTVYLFAHENAGGGGIAQASIEAESYKEAKVEFERRYEGRTLRTTGILGRV